jgi:hypothetical protein
MEIQSPFALFVQHKLSSERWLPSLGQGIFSLRSDYWRGIKGAADLLMACRLCFTYSS